MGCSTGAELYSILWSIRKRRSDLKITATGIDLSTSAIDKAKRGQYSANDPEVAGLPQELRSELFDNSGSALKVKEILTAGVDWVVGDVREDALHSSLGPQHIVVANNFLIFLKEVEAAACLRKIIRFVSPGGFLLCRGVDLDVRERVTLECALRPILLRIEELHEINPRERRGWPWEYWGLEPLDKTREDWARRYATIFHLPRPSDG
jgi:SAM-dependent methyltransferase